MSTRSTYGGHLSISPSFFDTSRKSFVFQPRHGELTWNLGDGTLAPMTEYGSAYELLLVNRVRDAVARWRASG